MATGAPAVAGDGCAVTARLGVIDRFAVIGLEVGPPLELPDPTKLIEPPGTIGCTLGGKTLIATIRGLSTALVMIWKSFLSAPAATLIEDGVLASLLPSDSPSVRPPTGAFPVSTTVPVDEAPPGTDCGLRESWSTTAGEMVRTAVGALAAGSPKTMVLLVPSEMFETPELSPRVAARKFTTVSVRTGFVVTTNVADDAPGGTLTAAGTDAAGEVSAGDVRLLAWRTADSRTVTPPLAGATPSRVTVPVALTPPTTLPGVIANVLADAGLTVTVALALSLPESACSVTVVRLTTPNV